MTRFALYDSNHQPVDGPFGFGWSHAYNVRLEETTDGCVHVLGRPDNDSRFEREKHQAVIKDRTVNPRNCSETLMELFSYSSLTAIPGISCQT